MYQPASKQLYFASDLYPQLSKTKTKCCQICKKVSERKKKSREVYKDVVTEYPTLPTPTTLDPQTAAMITTTALPALQHFATAAAAAKTENPFSEENVNTTSDRCRYHRCHRSPYLTMRRLCTLILFCTVFSIAEGCGPGRGIGGPRKYRKLTPLVFKQHVPNMSERTLGASGLNEGAIKRDSPKFKNLVPNYNKDIIFKDDEGTGADRLMSRRCKEKLNILAVSVMNQWPGVRLRVTESWDEDNAHHTDSLHYEGRAVDITTSDRDRTKYGMLARLAVEAGFDWVYYESRAHIHCSVKSDSKHIPHVSGCFAADSSVLLANGQRKYLRDLNIGDRVLAMSSTGKPVYSEVILFMDRNLEQMENFVRIHTDGDDNRNHNYNNKNNNNNDTTLTVTPAHLVLIWHPIEQKLEYIFADRVQEDDYVFVHDHYGRLSPRRVKRLEVVRRQGVVAPLTREGTIVVDSVTASCYAVVNSQTIAHWGLAPMRLMATIASWLPSSSSNSRRLAVNATMTTMKMTTQTWPNTTIASTAAARQINGIHWYAQFLNTLKDVVLPQRWLYQ